MINMKLQTITQDEYDELQELSTDARWEVRPDPENNIVGVVLSYRTKEYKIRQNNLTEFWAKLGKKYHFDPADVRDMTYDDNNKPQVRLIEDHERAPSRTV
jgi:hypothetical protein